MFNKTRSSPSLGVVMIKTFNRPELLKKSLESLFNCLDIEKFKVIVIQQAGNDQVNEVLSSFRDRIDSLLQTNPFGSSVDSYITNNTMLGYKIAFDFWRADFVVAIEEDAVVALDALRFVNFIFNKYRKKRRFRGINLGSKIEFSRDKVMTYSRTRYGMHGPASMITRRTWKKIPLNQVLAHHQIIFDAQLEFLLKSGFMVVPNCSRYIDLGRVGSHTGDGKLDYDYFDGLERSFVRLESLPATDYLEKSVKQFWRKDCLLYKRIFDPVYDLRAVAYNLLRSIGKL